MILSNVEIYRALDSGQLIIDPQPSPRTGQPDAPGKSPFNTSSVDLTLAPQASIPKEHLSVVIDPERGNLPQTIASLYDSHTISDAGFTLEQGKFLLARTVERVALPILVGGTSGLAARVEGRSSLARLGLLVHFTAPTIHAGFNGTITLEMINLGPSAIRLTPGMRICQLILEHVVGTPDRNDSMFQGQRAPAGPAT